MTTPNEADLKQAANRVRTAVGELNAAVHEAVQLGLDVRLEEIRNDIVGHPSATLYYVEVRRPI